jgi:hypothetical protein
MTGVGGLERVGFQEVMVVPGSFRPFRKDDASEEIRAIRVRSTLIM